VVPAVPVATGGQRVDLALHVTAPYHVRLDPYPFAHAEFEVTLATRELEDRAYESADEAAAAFHATPVRERRITVTAA
jgi:hypothetical protein